MTDERLNELIPDVEYNVDYKSMIRIYIPNGVQQQTENLRKAVKALIEGIKAMESLPYFLEVDSYEYQFRSNAIELIEQITGKPYKG